jgi:hypothetical protein
MRSGWWQSSHQAGRGRPAYMSLSRGRRNHRAQTQFVTLTPCICKATAKEKHRFSSQTFER